MQTTLNCGTGYERQINTHCAAAGIMFEAYTGGFRLPGRIEIGMRPTGVVIEHQPDDWRIVAEIGWLVNGTNAVGPGMAFRAYQAAVPGLRPLVGALLACSPDQMVYESLLQAVISACELLRDTEMLRVWRRVGLPSQSRFPELKTVQIKMPLPDDLDRTGRVQSSLINKNLTLVRGAYFRSSRNTARVPFPIVLTVPSDVLMLLDGVNGAG